MQLAADLLRLIGEALQQEAHRHNQDGNEEERNAWAVFQDAADALSDAASCLDAERG